MAIKLFDAIGFLRTDAKAMKKGLDKARSSAKTVLGKIGGIFKKFVKVGIKAFAALGAAIVGTIVAGLVQFAKLEKGLGEIMTLFGRIGDEAPALRKELEGIVRTLMVQFGQNLPDTIKGTYDAVSAGIKRADLGKFMQDAARLAIAGVTDIGKSVDVLTSLINSYSFAASDATMVSDLLFTTVKLGKTTLDELSQSMGQIAPIAAGANVSLRGMLGAMAVLTSQGLSTAEAATALKAAINSLLKPTGEAEELAEELGIDWSAQALAAKGLAGMMDILTKATGGDAAQMAKLLGSVRGLNAALILTSEEGSAKFRDSLSEMDTSTGATEAAFTTMEDTISFQWKKLMGALKTGLQGLGGVFGKTFKDLLARVNKWVKDNATSFEEFEKNAKRTADNLGQLFLEALEKLFPKLTKKLRETNLEMKNLGFWSEDARKTIERWKATSAPFIADLKSILSLLGFIARAAMAAASAINSIGFLAGSLFYGLQTDPWNISQLPDPYDPALRISGPRGDSINTTIQKVEIVIPGTDREPEDIGNAVGAALLDLGRAGAFSRGGVAVTP